MMMIVEVAIVIARAVTKVKEIVEIIMTLKGRLMRMQIKMKMMNSGSQRNLMIHPIQIHSLMGIKRMRTLMKEMNLKIKKHEIMR